MGPIYRLYQNTLFYQFLYICAVNNCVKGEVQLVALIAGSPFGRGSKPDQRGILFTLLLESIKDPFVTFSVW